MWTMWLVAFSVFAVCKLASLIPATRARCNMTLAYLCLWPGLDAQSFLHSTQVAPTSREEWAFAVLKTICGGLLLTINNAIPRMVGVVFLLHFGLFHLLSLAWRTVGVDAKPLMNWPILATSLADFWGRRWNTAFRDLSYQLVFRPLRRHPRLATWTVFLFSGLAHDVVMSLPVGSGYGLPTLYFMIQCAGLFLEKKLPALRGRVFTAAVLLLPLPLLLHEGFRNLFVR